MSITICFYLILIVSFDEMTCFYVIIEMFLFTEIKIPRENQNLIMIFSIIGKMHL